MKINKLFVKKFIQMIVILYDHHRIWLTTSSIKSVGRKSFQNKNNNSKQKLQGLWCIRFHFVIRFVDYDWLIMKIIQSYNSIQ